MLPMKMAESFTASEKDQKYFLFTLVWAYLLTLVTR